MPAGSTLSPSVSSPPAGEEATGTQEHPGKSSGVGDGDSSSPSSPPASQNNNNNNNVSNQHDQHVAAETLNPNVPEFVPKSKVV